MIGVVLKRYSQKDSWVHDLVARAIVWVTRSEITHAAVYVDGLLYESVGFAEKGIAHGYRMSRYSRCEHPEDIFLRLNRQIDEHQFEMVCRKEKRQRPYNVLKIMALAIVYPLRGLFNAIGWVPFDRMIFGETCSGYVDEVFKEYGIDLLPKRHEGYTAPRDFLESPELVREELL